MMEQLILHLIGDYITQTDKMAAEKVNHMDYAILHAVVYSIPFLLFLDISYSAFLVILLSHAIIDRFRLVRYIIFARNRFHDGSLKWKDCSKTGYHFSKPDWMSVWLMIIADNTLHLTINYFAITYL